jgi:hypothetical protein
MPSAGFVSASACVVLATAVLAVLASVLTK